MVRFADMRTGDPQFCAIGWTDQRGCRNGLRDIACEKSPPNMTLFSLFPMGYCAYTRDELKGFAPYGG